VHAAYALAEIGVESIMVNCNPETVSTDYDTSDRLYFEPLTAEDVLELIETERSSGELLGVIVQFGGQTPLKLAKPLEAAGIPILGTSPDAIDLAEDRERFQQLLHRLKIAQPVNAIARSRDEAFAAAHQVGYPVVIRPSYVLGGRAMEIVRDDEQLERYITTAVQVSGDSPVLIDQYLSRATEVDVDALCDAGGNVFVAGVMEHIEEAGVHSGDSACSLPPFSLTPETIAELKRQTEAMARALEVRGLMNVQFAIEEPHSASPRIYVLEVNPRASRTVPFVAKTIGRPVAAIAAKIMAGRPLAEFGLVDKVFDHVAVKEAVFPFAKVPKVDTVLGPEMRSTGEVMGLDWIRPGEGPGPAFARAFAKSQLGGGTVLPSKGCLFVSVRDDDKAWIAEAVRLVLEQGFRVLATSGTAAYLREQGLTVEVVKKVLEGRPHIVDTMKNGGVQLVFNTTEGKQSLLDSFEIRRSALMMKIPYFTTAPAALAAARAIAELAKAPLEVRPLQSYG
jgi:carbamoyl-phosphate synthase large subunit